MTRAATVLVPQSLDAGSLELLENDLEQASSEDARVLVLRGRPPAFCRGMAFESLPNDPVELERALQRFAAVLARLHHAARPTIAVVEGDAFGGGLGLAAACDRVIATTEARVALPEALFGVLPGVITPVLAGRMPIQKLRLMALDGTSRDASWALGAGLFDEVVDPRDHGRARARATSAMSRVSSERVHGLRSWCEEARHLGTADALGRGAALTSGLLQDPRVRAALRRFAEEGVAPWETQP
ncbi:MAG: enoyl-CoA hydratase/isomerase family protein [Polyangiaceae bacterium]